MRIKIDAAATEAERSEIFGALGALSALAALASWYSLTLQAPLSPQDAWDRLEDQPAVIDLEATPPMPVPAAAPRDDTCFPFASPWWCGSGQWPLNGQSEFGIQAVNAWSVQVAAAPVVVAVIDGGFDLEHPDLKGALWTNPNPDPAINDVHGISLGRDASGKPTVSGDVGATCVDRRDGQVSNHGSHVAGIIGATANNGVGISGVAPNVKLMLIRAICSDGGDWTVGLKYAVDHGASVVNLSIGRSGAPMAAEVEALRAAGAKGVVVALAAGNEKEDLDRVPGLSWLSRGSENVISVAASTRSGARAEFSNFGTSVDIAAPGQSIVSTLSGKQGTGYGLMDGTSMAAPHVAGVAALVKAKYPAAGAAEVKRRILGGARAVAGLNGASAQNRLLDAAGALTVPDASIPPYSAPATPPADYARSPFDDLLAQVQGRRWHSVDVSRFGAHTCAAAFYVAGQTNLYCWGYGNSWQLTDTIKPTPSQFNSPIAINVNGYVRQVGAGLNTTCALRSDGTVWCWGTGNSGELGNNTAGQARQPVQVIGLPKARAISNGASHACAVTWETREVYCWGNNSSGQLGTGDRTNRYAATVVPGSAGTRTVAAGDRFTCSRRPISNLNPFAPDTGDGVWCWGSNLNGRLGTDDAITTNRLVPTQTKLLANVKRLAVGATTACAEMDMIYCWGLVATDPAGTNPVPVPMAGAGGDLSVGDGACTNTNCFGPAKPRQVVGDDTVIAPVVTSRGAKRPLAKVRRGNSAGCGIERTEATLWCWGFDGSGQLGVGDSRQPSQAPLPMPGTTALAVGKGFTCGLNTSSAVVCRGDNSLGQLGGMSPTDPANAVTVPDLNLREYTPQDIDSGIAHTCAISNGTLSYPRGSVVCWGANGSGQLGNGTVSASGAPAAVPGLTNATIVSAGTDHSCAVAIRDGVSGLWCWGANTFGQLGNGTVTASRVPVLAASSLGAIAMISAGNGSTCVIGGHFDVYCWGRNDVGQLGANSAVMYSPTPMQVMREVPGTAGATLLQPLKAYRVSSGERRSCAIAYDQDQPAGSAPGPDDQKIFCWGASAVSTNQNLRYAAAAPLNSAAPVFSVSVALENDYTCATQTVPLAPVASGYTRILTCWGPGADQPTGDGVAWKKRELPLPVTVTDEQYVTVSPDAACIVDRSGPLLSNRRSHCWGANDKFQTHGRNAARVMPTQVIAT